MLDELDAMDSFLNGCGIKLLQKCLEKNLWNHKIYGRPIDEKKPSKPNGFLAKWCTFLIDLLAPMLLEMYN